MWCAAYVAGERQGLVQERPFRLGETLKEGTHLDIDVELRLAKDLQKQMQADGSMDPKAERKAMKDLGLARARHFGWPNTYVFTKSMGEMMLGQMLRSEADVPVVIVRPSIITSVQNDPLPGWIEGTRYGGVMFVFVFLFKHPDSKFKISVLLFIENTNWHSIFRRN